VVEVVVVWLVVVVAGWVVVVVLGAVVVAVFVAVVWLVEVVFVVDVLCAGGFGFVVFVRGLGVVWVGVVVLVCVADRACEVVELDLALPPQAATIRASTKTPAVPAIARVQAAGQRRDDRVAANRSGIQRKLRSRHGRAIRASPADVRAQLPSFA
jgi:hypothetical protein